MTVNVVSLLSKTAQTHTAQNQFFFSSDGSEHECRRAGQADHPRSDPPAAAPVCSSRASVRVDCGTVGADRVRVHGLPRTMNKK